MVIDTSEQVRGAVVDATRATVAGLVISTGLGAVKISAGLIGNSFALVADGVESVLDVFSGIMVWGGLRVSASPRSDKFPFGRGKAEPLSALFVATVLLLVAVAIAVGAILEILSPGVPPAAWTLWVLVIVMVGKEATYRMLLRSGDRTRSQALRADAWHHRSDALTSLAAFLGISLTLLGGDRFISADDWAALVACVIIAWNGSRIMRMAFAEVLDVAAPPEIHTRVRSLASEVPRVSAVELLRIRKSGLVFWVDIHIEVDPDLTVREGHEIAHEVKDRLIGSELPILEALVHVEPLTPDSKGGSG